MNRFALVGALALFATACDDFGALPPASGDTGPVTCDVYDGPISIEEPTITCAGDEVTFELSTIGVPSDGLVFSQDTANNSPFSDEHDLVIEASDEDCGEFATLSQNVETCPTLGSCSINEASRNTFTLFTCNADEHYAADDVMTYAFRIYDNDGNLTDCSVSGNNPQDLFDGSFGTSDPTDANEINNTNCTVDTIQAAY